MAVLCSGRPYVVANIAISLLLLAATASWVTHAHEATDFTVVPYNVSQAPSAQPEAGCYQRSSCSCGGCPGSHQCTQLKAWGKTYPTCSNVFTQAPTLPVGQVTLDNDLCKDWATSKALYLGPMYQGGDCSKKRLGALYGLYDCLKKRVCLKASSCVGSAGSLYDNAPEEDVRADNNPPGGTYNCPGVGCGCYDNNQARAQCSQIDYSPRNNWYYLTQLCDKTTDRTQSNIPVSRYPGSGGVRSGWEDCWPVAEDVQMSVQAHFSVDGRSVDNQRPDIRPHHIKFKTPTCPSSVACGAVTTVSSPTVCADATSAAATFSITTFGPVTISVLCPGREPIDQQLAVPHSNTVREISCAKPAAGWKAGDRIQLRISAGAGQPPCNPVFAAAQLTVLPTPRLRVTPEGTPAPVCYGSKTATARFRVLSDEVTGAGTFTYDVDSGCTTEVTAAGSSRLVSVTCSNSAGYTSDTVGVALSVIAVNSFCGGTLSQSATSTVVVKSPPRVSLTTVDPQPILAACGGTGSLKASFNYNIVSDVGGTVEISASYGAEESGCTVTDGPISPLRSAGVSGTFTVSCTGDFPVGSTPTGDINVVMKVSKRGCTYQATAGSTATFGPLFCCTEGDSYVTVTSFGVRQVCFKDAQSTCESKDRWGFYIPFDVGYDFIPDKMVAGGGDCAQGTVVGDVDLFCEFDGTNSLVALEVTVRNFAASLITAQNYYVGCQRPRSCSPPDFGAVSTASDCVVGATVNGAVTLSCGGAFPGTTVNPNGGVKSQTFKVAIEPSASGITGCTSCRKLVVIVQQSGTFVGDPNFGQCPAK